MSTGTGGRLGARDTAGVVIGAVVGVGIFFSPSGTASRAGDGARALAVWAVAGVVALLGALTFAELGARLPKSGGQYLALKEAFGARTGVTYMAVVGLGESAAAAAILALVCARNLSEVAGIPFGPAGTAGLAVALVAAAFALAAAGVRTGAAAIQVNLAAKLAALAVLVALAARRAPPEAADAFRFADPGPSAGALATAFLPALFAYGGWQQSLWIAGEVRDPGRNLPRGIVGGTLVVVVTYVAVNWAYLRLLGPEGVAGAGALAAEAADVAAPGLGRWVAAAVAWSAFGCLQTLTFTAPHQLAVLAQDGLAPRRFGAVDARSGAPRLAAAAFAATAAALAVGAGMEHLGALLTAVVCVDWIFFALTALALFRLRRRADLPTPFRVPGYPWAPATFALVAVAAAASPFFTVQTRTAGVVAVGITLTLALVARLFLRAAPEAGPGR
ncbi:MAG TPA: amino acid permease [Planctomycetota bacterium]|nr:amino acid permease [Planctomycetota bacterium]